MGVFANIEKDKGAGTASAAIAEGRFLKRSGAGTVAQETVGTAAVLGVSAAAAENGGQVRMYLPGQICRVQAGADLNPATAAHRYLASDANGKAVAAVANDVIAALWLPSGAVDPAADQFITVLLTDQTSIKA